MMTDPVADMLTRVRNALNVGHEILDIPYSRLKLGVIDVLKREGYIWNYEVLEGKPAGMIRIQLRYGNNGEAVIQRIRRISKPGRRCYVSHKGLSPVLNGLGISILSTNAGILSDREARERKVGGEVLCEVW